MDDFRDTVPVDMSNYAGVQCDNCGAMNDVFEVEVVTLSESSVAWVCKSCGGHNFQEHEAPDADGDLSADPVDGDGDADDPAEHFGDEDDGSGDFICDHCGERPGSGDEISEGMQEGPDDTIIWSCPTCGHWNDYV